MSNATEGFKLEYRHNSVLREKVITIECDMERPLQLYRSIDANAMTVLCLLFFNSWAKKC